jgi:RND family efflux transporter MFP subunit
MMAQERTNITKTPRPARRPILVFFAVLGLIVAVTIVAGVLPRLSRQKGLLAAAEQVAERKPVVLVSPAHFGTSKDTIDLPADLVAMIESPIFARADGYLKSRLVDYGNHVKAGQLMAEIETPELDQQIGQAHANLDQAQASLKELESDIDLARANLALSRVTFDRWQHLQAKGAVSKQDLDTRQADLGVRQAELRKAESALATAQNTVNANAANLRRLEELKGFARITAPFDGVVTVRDVDVGYLINAGSKELFRVAQIDPLRIFVNVPQTYVSSISQGQSAELRVQERPGQVWSARVTGISNSLDTNSRAMLVILETRNPGGTLFPGMYAQVRFSTAPVKPILRIIGDALLLGKSGARVAVAGTDGIVHFRNVTIGQDLGSEVEITSGLEPGEMVISNPTDAVTEGVAVEARKR